MQTTKEQLLEIQRLQIAVNKADMARARGAARLFQDFSSDHLARKAADPHFTLTPLAELTCFASTCSKAACECELDHNQPYPEGETRTGNLRPGCTRHHVSKHGPGAALTQNPDGSLRYRLRSGMTHLITPAEVPVCDDPAVAPRWQRLLEIQPNVADLTTALDDLAASQQIHAEHTIRQAEELTRLEADYRASYPNASEEDIDHWIWATHTPTRSTTPHPSSTRPASPSTKHQPRTSFQHSSTESVTSRSVGRGDRHPSKDR